MRNGKDNNSCLFGEELVSYVYGELPASGRSAFEEHLLNCGGCTDEFAAVSMSRLGVYEWHRDEFLSLETPVFAIPYERPIVETGRAFGWLDTLRGLLSPARLATAGGAFAILAAAFGAFYVLTSNNSQQIAVNGNISVPAIVEQIPASPKSDFTITAVSPTTGIDDNSIKVVSKPADRPTRAVQAKVKRATPNRPVVTQASATPKAPRLGTFDDAEDKSLRLADLVADIDSDDD